MFDRIMGLIPGFERLLSDFKQDTDKMNTFFQYVHQFQAILHYYY